MKQLERATWGRLRERDLDLMLLQLLHTDGAFRRHVADAVGFGGLAMGNGFNAWHSVSHEGRESDLVAEWAFEDGRTALLLIEDKISAEFQPGQARSYSDRATTALEDSSRVTVKTLLIAPNSYRRQHSEDVALFDSFLPLEAVAGWFAEQTGSRAAYVAEFVKHAIAPCKPTTGEHNRQYPEFYELVRNLIDNHYPGLVISSESETGWMYFKVAGVTGSMLRYRFNDGWVELVFKKKRLLRGTLAHALEEYPIVGAAIAERGKSEIVIWAPTGEILVGPEVSRNRGSVLSALATVNDLREWCAVHGLELGRGSLG